MAVFAHHAKENTSDQENKTIMFCGDAISKSHGSWDEQLERT
jgi:hypothetical protein